jgi:hypothetical protein
VVLFRSSWIYTMRRCASALTCAGLFAFWALPIAAQSPRNFPATALRGELVVTAPPEVLLNRQPARLAPGSRMRGMDNMLVLSGAAVNQRMLVHYTRDPNGNVLDVWILTPAEAARKPWPGTPQEAAAWSFNADQQTWTKP